MATKKKTTTKDPAQEVQQPTPEAPAPAPEIKEPPQEAPDAQEVQQPTPEPPEAQEDAPEAFSPYEATVAVPLAVIRRGKTPSSEDKPIGTITRGDRVTVTDSVDGFAMLANGTYVKEAYLERKA